MSTPKRMTLYTWSKNAECPKCRKQEKRMDPKLFGKKECWVWIDKGGKGRDPEGILYLPYGFESTMHLHEPKEDFKLLKGSAIMKIGKKKWKKMPKTPVHVAARTQHGFKSTSREGSYLHFTFPGYKQHWSTIRYQFARNPTTSKQN